MKNQMNIIAANILRYSARIGLLIIGLALSWLGIVSGAEAYGGGVNGVISNMPNAFPWIILLCLLIIAWRSEFVGGVMIGIVGILYYWFFNLVGSNFFPPVAYVTIAICVFGIFLILSWRLRKTAL